MVDYLSDALRAAREVEIEKWAEQRSPQALPVGDRGVDVGNTSHALFNQVERLAPEFCLQAIGDMAFHFPPNVDRLLANRGIEGQSALNHLRRGHTPSYHPDQRD
jgi:hypothetical protein